MLPKLASSGLHLLNALLTYDPAHRPSAQEALRHRYFGENPVPGDTLPSFLGSSHEKRPARRNFN